MSKYQVVNTTTGSAIAGPFETIREAEEKMMEMFPETVPWDGVEVPVAIQEVGPRTPMQDMLREIEMRLKDTEDSLLRTGDEVIKRVEEAKRQLQNDYHVNSLGILQAQGAIIDRLASERELLVQLRNAARYHVEKEAQS